MKHERKLKIQRLSQKQPWVIVDVQEGREKQAQKTIEDTDKV